MSVPFKTLTKTQRNYLKCIDERGTLQQGWGGYGSTQTVRLLEERGLINLRRFPTKLNSGRIAERWTAQLTNAGKAWLDDHEQKGA